MSEIYISVDVETDGPCPGLNSMLSIGCVAFDAAGNELDEFSRNLCQMEDASPDPSTLNWWRGNLSAWVATRKDLVEPEQAMQDLDEWLLGLSEGKRVFVAYPAGFDFTFVYWYCHKFLGHSPFGFQALDLKTYAMALLGTEFKSTSKRTMPKEWFDGTKHTHIAVEDAREQGKLFFAMRDWVGD